MLSFELKEDSQEAASRLAYSLKVATMAPSLGAVETLCTLPACSSHSGEVDCIDALIDGWMNASGWKREDRIKAGISDSLVRVSVGLEAIDDLITDFGAALEKV